jgi:hypothetical protein
MKKYLSLLFLILIASCNYDKIHKLKTNAESPKTEILTSEKLIDENLTNRKVNDERLDRHFSSHKIKPLVLVKNNEERNITDIKLSNHSIKWFSKNGETTLQIAGLSYKN